MLRFLTAGESHGPALTAIIEGFPAGVPLDKQVIDEQLKRRQSSFGRGGRMKIERDEAEVLSGVRKGLTLGSPITLVIRNRDWENWHDVMSADAGEINAEREAEKRITRPRPGHADLAGALKYRYTDLRNVLERASARETAARVAVGTVARMLLEHLGCMIFSHVVQIGVADCNTADADRKEYAEIAELARSSPVGCADREKAGEMIQEIERAQEAGDTLGGVFEVICLGLPPGLGSHVHWDRRLDTRLAAALMSIPSVKGVEIGLGFRGVGLAGSKFHDPVCYEKGRGFYRPTNHAGGIEGGMTNGEPLVMRAAVKPVPTLRNPLPSMDLFTKEEAGAAVERSDVCVVPAAAVVAEAVTAWVLADAVLEKFGKDTLDEIRLRWQEYRAYLEKV
ncbi:MAG TPA: chorismate synthase [Syntrophomonadaceae bacterium]|nr:chorismate synthase [Syntrophomonadaceae bacterium]